MADEDHASGNEASAILDVIDDAIEEHDQWLQRWHRAMVVGGEPPGDVVSENAQYICRLGVWLELNNMALHLQNIYHGRLILIQVRLLLCR